MTSANFSMRQSKDTPWRRMTGRNTETNPTSCQTLRESFVEVIYGKLVGDKGYISQDLFRELFVNDIQLITKIRNNMKNSLMSVADKVYLRKRAVIESVNDEQKNIAQIEHSRHRSVNNFMVNAVSAIAAYCFFPKKPSISIETYSDNQLVLF
jgi:hypothetical protein